MVMFTREELHQRLNTIFEKEKRDMEENGFNPAVTIRKHDEGHIRGGIVEHRPAIYNRDTQTVASLYDEVPENDICRDVPNTYLKYDNLDLLNKLYSKISSNENLIQEFVLWLKKHISENSTTMSSSLPGRWFSERTTAGLAVHFLIRINKHFDLMQSIKKRAEKKLISLDIYNAFKRIIKYEHHLLDDEKLSNIEAMVDLLFIKGVVLMSDEGGYKINQKVKLMNNLIERVRLFRLKKELLGNDNYEINQDTERLKEFIDKYEFDKRLALALNKINKDYYNIKEDEFHISNNLSLLRKIFDPLVKSIKDKIVELTGEKPTKVLDDSKQQKIELHRFIGKHIKLTDGEKRTLAGLYDMLNEESHRLIGKKEKWRLTKSFMIEFLVLMFVKLNALENNI